MVFPLFQPLMGVFDHHDGGVNHRPYGNGDTAQRHDVGVQPLKMHDDKGDTEPKRQRDNRHQSGADVPQEQRADQCYDDKLLQQLAAEVVDRPVDQLAAIVGRHDFYPFRQAAFQGLELVFNGGNHFAGVFAGAQDHHAAGHFAFTVQFGNAAAHFRAHLYPRHIAQKDRHAVVAGSQHDIIEVIQRLQVAAGAHHILSFRQLDGGTARLLVGGIQRGFHRRQADAILGQFLRVDDNLILFDHAADRCHFRDIGDGFQLIF